LRKEREQGRDDRGKRRELDGGEGKGGSAFASYVVLFRFRLTHRFLKSFFFPMFKGGSEERTKIDCCKREKL
jgi:hypothetical protein